MHRNLNISTEEGTRRPKYEKMLQANQNPTNYDKENTYSYSPTTVSPKKSFDYQTQGSQLQDSFEEPQPAPDTNYRSQYHSKRSSELRETSQSRRNILQNGSYRKNGETFEKARNYSESDVKLLNQEVIALRKSLSEAQTKASTLSKEFSKVQHENSIFQSQLRRSEVKIKELIEIHSTDQAKLSEITLQRNQLHNELSKMKIEILEAVKAKENAENLKSNLSDMENLIEHRNKKLFKQIKQLSVCLGSLQGLISSSDSPRSEHCQSIFEKIQVVMHNVVNISGCGDMEELNSMQESNGFNTMVKFREAMTEYENENTELKDHIIYLDNLLQKEELKNKELLPQYKESIDKLRKNVHKIKEQLKETQQHRIEERNHYLERLEEAENFSKEIVEENIALKTINEELANKLKQNEALALHNEEKIKKLVKDYAKLEASMKLMQRADGHSSVYMSSNKRKSSNNDRSAAVSHKGPRSLSKDNQILNRSLTEEDEDFSRAIQARSSSVARRRPSGIQDNQKSNKLYKKQISTDMSFDCLPQTCQTFSNNDNKKKDVNSLNKTFEAERLKASKTAKHADNKMHPQFLPKGTFRRNYESNPQYYVQDNSQVYEDREDVNGREDEHSFVSGQVDKSYCRTGLNTSNYGGNPQDCSYATSFNHDLRDEIVSLDNEIGQIQKYMVNHLDIENVN